eukprot:4219030-Pyramimonas_sp.AAC.1
MGLPDLPMPTPLVRCFPMSLTFAHPEAHPGLLGRGVAQAREVGAALAAAFTLPLALEDSARSA